MQVNFSAEAIVDIVKKSPSKAGSWNIFVKMNDYIGLKLCSKSYQRDGNYFRQKEASKIGLGPDTHGKVDVSIDGIMFYGYFTEIVSIDLSNFSKREIENEANSLRKKLKKIFDFEDNHRWNLGIKNGKFVCIDFDDLDDDACYDSNDCDDTYYNFTQVVDSNTITIV